MSDKKQPKRLGKLEPIDRDIQVLADCITALDRSSSRTMKRANLEFLLSRYGFKPFISEIKEDPF